MTLVFHPSFEQTAVSGVERVERVDDLYTIFRLNGSTSAARLPEADDGDVMAVIAAVEAAHENFVLVG